MGPPAKGPSCLGQRRTHSRALGESLIREKEVWPSGNARISAFTRPSPLPLNLRLLLCPAALLVGWVSIKGIWLLTQGVYSQPLTGHSPPQGDKDARTEMTTGPSGTSGNIGAEPTSAKCLESADGPPQTLADVLMSEVCSQLPTSTPPALKSALSEGGAVGHESAAFLNKVAFLAPTPYLLTYWPVMRQVTRA